MKKRICLIMVLFAIALCPVALLGRGKVRVLYVTQSKGFKHAVLPESEAIMRDLAAKSGFELTVSQEADRAITPDSLKNLDVVIFYTTGELPLSDEQKEAFLEFVKSGKTFIGLHSATDTFYQWPAYGAMINGYFDGHPWTQDSEVTIKADDRRHATTRHFPPSMTFKEEIYQFKNFDPQAVKVLVSLDTTKTDMTKKGIKASSFPLVWHRPYGKGRVFYSALGHRPEIWQSDWYQQMLVNAIKWGVGDLK